MFCSGLLLFQNSYAFNGGHNSKKPIKENKSPFVYCVPTTTNGCSLGDSLTYFSLKGTSGTVTYNPSGPTCNASPLAYSDYTATFAAVMLVRGESFSGFMRTGRPDDYATIWIDANDNDVFEDNERILSNLKIGTVKKLYSIYVPATMNTGNHRLRVRIIYSAILPQTLTHACNNYSESETEDYLVNITSTASTRNVAPGIAGLCNESSETTIGPASNNSSISASPMVVLLDSSNRYIAGIRADGLNMGVVKASFYKHIGPVRFDAISGYYLDRNLSLDIENGLPTASYQLRFFFLNTELGALIAQPGSGVTSVFDLNSTKTTFNYCSSEFVSGSSTFSYTSSFGTLSPDRFLDFSSISGTTRSFYLHGGTTILCCYEAGGTCFDNCLAITSVSSNYLPSFNICNGAPVGNEFSFILNYFVPGVGNIIITAPYGFEVSLIPGTGFSNSVSIVGASLGSSVNVYVRMVTPVSGSPFGNIVISNSQNASTQKIFVSSTAIAAPAELAGAAGGSSVSQTAGIVSTGTLFTDPTFPCKLIAKATPSGSGPVSGNVTAKVWVESSVGLFGFAPYVSRHFDFQPATNPTTSTGTITLYFSQAEFEAFNSHTSSLLDLPVNPSDATGKNNLRVYKFGGTSYDGSGLPYTYTGQPEIIDPTDASIQWNSATSFWEVTFNVTGFGGFTVGTTGLLNLCKNGSGKINTGSATGPYQWQANTGSGFLNITDGANYTGTNSATLFLINLPTSFYGYKYRCLINGNPSDIYEVKFVSYWQGNTNTAWATVTNWAVCSILPDNNTDVVIPSGRTNYPVLGSSTTIRSLRNESGSSLNVQPGVILLLTGQ